jgi:hypothetical protein
MTGEPPPDLDRESERAARLLRESVAFRLIARAGDAGLRAVDGSEVLRWARLQAEAFRRLAPPVRRCAVGWLLMFAALTNGALLLVLAGPLGRAATLDVPLLTAVAAVVLLVTGRATVVDSNE